jgi:hypothetical protein
MGTMTRRFGLLLACVAALGFGCKDKDRPPTMDAGPDVPDGEVDAEVPGPCDPQPGEDTYYFLVSDLGFVVDKFTLDAEGMPNGGETAGFDLSQGANNCGHSEFSWEGATGINNQLAVLVFVIQELMGVYVNDALMESIASGDVLILARVSAWNGDPDDECVDLALLLGTVPEGEPEDYVGSCDGEPGSLVCTVNSGLVVDVDPASFLPGTSVPQIGVNQQVVEGGRVMTDPVTLSLTLPIGDTPASLTVRQTSLRFDITPTSLSGGILGGSLFVEDAIPVFSELVDEGLQGVVESLLWSAADLMPAAGVCQAISMGMQFQGVDMLPGIIGDAPPCMYNSECDDGNPCTSNRCDRDVGTCVRFYEDPNVPCAAGICNGNGACVQCLQTDDCDDGLCTTDGRCVECLSATDCDGELHCSPNGACVQCLDEAHCEDDEFDCTDKACLSGTCGQVPVHSRCDDGVGCTDDTCSVSSGCVFTPNPSNCADGNECTLTPCDPVDDCQVTNVADDTSCSGGTCQGGMCTP